MLYRSNTSTGTAAEDHAARFLERLGHEILKRNWRFKKAEIDIISEFEGTLHITEVKSRSYIFYGEPEISVSINKQHRLIDAAYQFIIEYQWEGPLQFNIISVVFNGKKLPFLLKYFEDAFF